MKLSDIYGVFTSKKTPTSPPAIPSSSSSNDGKEIGGSSFASQLLCNTLFSGSSSPKTSNILLNVGVGDVGRVSHTPVEGGKTSSWLSFLSSRGEKKPQISLISPPSPSCSSSSPQNLNCIESPLEQNNILQDVAPYTPDQYGSSYPTPEKYLEDPDSIPTYFVFQSNMVTDEDLQPGMLRNLEVDKRLTLPTRTHIRFLITAGDVIHSWAVPSLGIKADAVPGRLHRVNCFIQREGVFYGQCSELCGALHGFMPIVVEAVSPETYAAHARKYYRE